MPKKKYIRRKIQREKTYLDNSMNTQAVGLLQEILATFKKRYKYVHFGITTDYKAQYDHHHTKDPICWSSMRLVFKTAYAPDAEHFESKIKQHENYINNNIKFPETLFDEHPEYYVYVMVGRRKKSKNKYMKTSFKEKIRIFEGFAGYGGASFGLKRLKENMPEIDYEVIGYSEFDKFAASLFDANHKDKDGNLLKNWGDITKIDPNELPDFDMFMGGFPCQPFSSAGMQMGTEDPYGRGAMLSHIIRICRVKKPKYLLLENVKGFTSGKFKTIHDQLIRDLREMGYGDEPLAKAVLNSKNYGVPQNRERLWMFARLGGLPKDFDIVPPKIESSVKMADFLDYEPEAYLYLSQEQIAHLKVKHNIDSFVVSTPLCFDVYNKKIKFDGYSITITQPEHNSLRVIEVPKADGKEIVRKMSIHEQFRLMGFRISRDKKQCEINFDNQSYSQLSKRAGNGWDVNLVGILLTHIFKQL